MNGLKMYSYRAWWIYDIIQWSKRVHRETYTKSSIAFFIIIYLSICLEVLFFFQSNMKRLKRFSCRICSTVYNEHINRRKNN